ITPIKIHFKLANFIDGGFTSLPLAYKSSLVLQSRIFLYVTRVSCIFDNVSFKLSPADFNLFCDLSKATFEFAFNFSLSILINANTSSHRIYKKRGWDITSLK